MADFWNEDCYDADDTFNLALLSSRARKSCPVIQPPDLMADKKQAFKRSATSIVPGPSRTKMEDRPRPRERRNSQGSADGEPAKPKLARVKTIEMRTVKATDGGATFNATKANVNDYSHVKVDFNKFTMLETRRRKGTEETLSVCLDAKDLPRRWLSKLKVKLGGEEIEIQTEAFKLTCLFAKVALPTQGFLSMEYISPHGDLHYVENHPIKIDFGEAKGSSACAIL